MRLICPTCETAYDVPAEQIPAGGREVQCSICRTKWLARPVKEPEPSEEQIIYRLETRTARPRSIAPVPAAAPPPPPEPGAAPTESRDDFVWETAAPARPASLDPLRQPVAERRPPPEPPVREQAAPPPHMLRPSPPPPPPAEPEPPRVDVQQKLPPPAPAAPPAPRPEPPRSELPPPLPARPAEVPQPRALPGIPGDAVRIEGRAQPPQEPDAGPVEARVVEPPPRSRFGRGLFVALALFGTALAVYLYGRELAAGVPALAPAVEAYSGAVDRLREALAAEVYGR